MKINEILTINLTEDIKNVIDLEDISEKEIQSEIENYIVTDGLAREYAKFVDIYTSNILETGVWISGFYGSGKSYFGKLLGYMLSNRLIAGTPARNRIVQRFNGINDEALIKHSLSRLNSINSRVVFLDIAKQNTDNGLAFTLFRNFLRSLSLPENEYGFFLYQLMLSKNQIKVKDFIENEINTVADWEEIRTNLLKYSKFIKEIYINSGNTVADFENILNTIREDIKQFSSSRLKVELSNFLQIEKNENIVFLFDEASEAINQKKFTLLDLEGISESLSSLGGKVWTIAIAQEKLDEVIKSSNINKAQLTKVTDRFKTKIHLEATEVDVIIRNRLLKKTESGLQKLTEYYNQNSGKIADHADIKGSGISKTDNVENYTTYYPFYKYQFNLLQNFLFGTKGYASTKVAARGMIITTYEILKRQVQNLDVYNTVTGWHITKEGQQSPSLSLVNRYDNAERILKEEGFSISGRKLLETINFLSEAEVTPTTLPNIIKSFVSNSDEQSKIKVDIEKALSLLTEAKVLLDTNNIYRITSDIEQKLLEEMIGFSVQGYIKKSQLLSVFKSAQLTKTIAKLNDNGLLYDFYITADNEEELTPNSPKYLKIKIKSIYEISESRSNDIDNLKVQHQNDKDLLWLVPDNSKFKDIDRLIEEIKRIDYLEQKYNNPNTEEGKILMSFSTAKSEKQNRLNLLVDEALFNSTAIYLYNSYQLNNDNWQTTIQTQQKQIIQNMYSKRLNSQLSDSIAQSVIKEANSARLSQYFASNDFAFFDTQGNFIGENLKVSEEILYKMRNTFLDGATLEKELEVPPTGYSFGTVISSVAALMRAGRVIAKYNGVEKFSWRDNGVSEIFNAAREFRKASFKAVSKSLNISQKQDLVQFLLDLEVENYIGRRIDYNTNDFELVNAIRDLAKHFADKVITLRNSEKEFDRLFPQAEVKATFLNDFTGSVSEANYIEKAIDILAVTEQYQSAIQDIEAIEKFIRNNLAKVKEWNEFIKAVDDEFKKAAMSKSTIEQLKNEFESHLQGDIIKKFNELQKIVQKTKDEYYLLFSDAMKECANKYKELETLANKIIDEINTLPAGLNDSAINKCNAIKQYATQRTNENIQLDYNVKDKQSRFTYSEVLSFIELYSSKKTDIDIMRSGLIREKAPETQSNTETNLLPKKYSVSLPKSKMNVDEYREWLQIELKKLATLSNIDEIEFDTK